MPQAAALPAAAAAAVPGGAAAAHAAQTSALALHLCTSALTQSVENHMMLAHLANETLFLRGMCAELSNQNAALAHTVAAQLARKRKDRASAARLAMNAADMASNTLLRDSLLTGNLARGFPIGEYPDHPSSSSDSDYSDSEPAARDAEYDGVGAAGGAGAEAAEMEAGALDR